MDASNPTAPPAHPPEAGPPPAGARPGSVTAAGITLIVLGIITGIVALFLLLGAAAFSGAAGGLDPVDMPGAGSVLGAIAGFVVVFMLLVLGWAALQLVSGFQVLAGREWARVTAIVISVIGVVLALAGLGGEGGSSNVVVALAYVIAQGFVIYAMATSGDWFASRRA